MKITRSQLKQIIKEEIESILGEQADAQALDEYSGAGFKYDCTKECTGGERLDYSKHRACIEACMRRRERQADASAEKSMGQASWRESLKRK